jgi:O-antigen/teichoic acid export membrane protein
VLAGIALVAYPSMGRQAADHGSVYVRRRGPVFVALNVGGAVAYGFIIAGLGHFLLETMYGPGYYTEYAWLVPLLAVTAVVTALAQSLSILVRVIDRPQAVLWSKLAAAIWLAGAGIVFVKAFGVTGAVLSLAGGALAEAVVLTVILTRDVWGAGHTRSPARNL